MVPSAHEHAHTHPHTHNTHTHTPTEEYVHLIDQKQAFLQLCQSRFNLVGLALKKVLGDCAHVRERFLLEKPVHATFDGGVARLSLEFSTQRSLARSVGTNPDIIFENLRLIEDILKA